MVGGSVSLPPTGIEDSKIHQERVQIRLSAPVKVVGKKMWTAPWSVPTAIVKSVPANDRMGSVTSARVVQTSLTSVVNLGKVVSTKEGGEKKSHRQRKLEDG